MSSIDALQRSDIDNARQLQFVASNGLSFVCHLGVGAGGYLISGYGGWQTVQRWKRTSLTQFVGPDPVRLALPILFDGWRERVGQEEKISTLERMASHAPGEHPPTIRIYGATPRRDIKKWVIESLDFSQQQHVIWHIQNGVPVRLRQDVIVNLLQHVEGDRIKVTTKGTGLGPGGRPGGARPTPKHKWHVVRAGETIYRIAKEEYGNARWYKDIIKANHLRSPNALRTGQRLRMP